MPAIDMAEQLAAEEEFGQAAELILQALDANPPDPGTLNDLGVIAFKQGRPDVAVTCLGQALAAKPDLDEAVHNLCAVLGTLPDETLENNALFAWPYLLVRVSSENWDVEDSRFLAKTASLLSDLQREMLIRLFMQSARQEIDKDISTVASGMQSMSADLARALGDWMSAFPAARSFRDSIEQAICTTCKDEFVVRAIARRAAPSIPDPQTRPVFQFQPRRLTQSLLAGDPFLKLVPPGAPKKDGLRILLIADFNIAGQLTGLMRALNKYTNHAARCVILQDDYLAYDHDIVITDRQGSVFESEMAEATDLVKRADFFHIGRALLNLPGINWNTYISPRNAVFQYYGSELRDNGPAVARFHAQTGFTAITATDYTMYRLLPESFYHIQPYLLEMDDLPLAPMDISGDLRVCHAPSSQNYRNIKRSDIILDVMRRLEHEDRRIRAVEIAGLTNAECLGLKATCHLHIVSLLFTFGLNAIESAAQGLVPITPLDNFTMLLYPDTPVIHATPSSLYDVTKKLLAEPVRLAELGQACREWARREFDAKVLVQKYWYLYDLVYHGFSLDYPDQFNSWMRTQR